MKLREIKKEIVKNIFVSIGYECDICGVKTDKVSLPDTWHELTHSHNGWGNDSCDSVETFHVCSPSCYVEQVKSSIREVGGYSDSEIGEFTGEFMIELVKLFKQ